MGLFDGKVAIVTGAGRTDDKPWTIESLDAQRKALFAESGEGVPPFLTPAEQ